MFGLSRVRAPSIAARSKVEELFIHGRNVEVSRRAYQRSLNLTLKVNGVIRVKAPKGLSIAHIRDFVESQQEWIETNLKKYESIRETYPPKQMRAGEVFPFLGESYRLAFEPVKGKPDFRFVEGQLICGIRAETWSSFDPQAAHPELVPAVVTFYKKIARQVLTDSLEIFSERMGLKPTAVSFRAQRTRWGSCSSRGRISLNWKLIIAPLDTINYVVVHELSHLKYYDHSAEFWALVATQSPDYAERRFWLRDNQFLADFLASESELHPSPGAQ